MTTKEKTLEILEKNIGKSVSGQELADAIGVSRNAVWKSVNALISEGHVISATTNKGYLLEKKADILLEKSIKEHLKNSHKIIILDTINSTNIYAKNLDEKIAENNTVVIANEQTDGHGRFGKSFFSPRNTGLYMSIILRPQRPVSEMYLLTVIAAVSVCEALSECTGLSPKIKWVNDIFLNDKKICGILTEASTDFETGIAERIVVGIGVNTQFPENDFPSELKEIASAINLNNIERNKIAAEIINKFDIYLEENNSKKIIKKYKENSYVLNKKVEYIKNNIKYSAIATDINESGNLVVTLDDGTTDILKSGEISIKKA